MPQPYAGRCACGQVTFELAAEPMLVQCCHCLDCQRETGGAFVLNAIIETDNIRLLSGQPEPVAVPTNSGRPHDIYRCPSCQVAVWSDYGKRSYMRYVRLGVLDDPSNIRPDLHVYTRTKLPWVTISGDIPAFEEFYSMKDVWPAEAQERRQAASDAAKRAAQG